MLCKLVKSQPEKEREREKTMPLACHTVAHVKSRVRLDRRIM